MFPLPKSRESPGQSPVSPLANSIRCKFIIRKVKVMLSLTRRVLQEREGDVRLDALGGMGVHPDSLGSAGLLPLGDHLLGHAVADEVAARRSGQAHGALGTRSQTDVIVGVTVGSAAPGGLLTRC